MQPHRSFLILNIETMDDLPKMERWLIQHHFPDSVMAVGPSMDRYMSYRAVPPRPEMYEDVKEFGYYNWRVTEHWFAHDRVPFTPTLRSRLGDWVPDAKNIKNLANNPGWSGTKDGHHPVVEGLVPLVHTNDWVGNRLSLEDPPMLRWYVAHKYPEGVSEEEGEDWFVNVHAKELMQQPGLTRFFSSVTLDLGPRPRVWHRLTELWYESFSDWKRDNIISPPKFTKPSWATYDKYPFFEPYVDYCSTFILECPTNDYMHGYQAYIPT